jgi:hypothetical protein
MLALVPAAAFGDGVAATVAPSEVSVATNTHAVVHVIVVNGTAKPMVRVFLRPLRAGADGVTLIPRDSAPRKVPAGESTRFIVDVTTARPLLSARTVSMLVRYRQGPVARWATAALKVTAPPARDPAALASVSVAASLGDLKAGRSKRSVVIVTNTSAEPLTVGPIRVRSPDFIEQPKQPSATVAAHATKGIPVELDLEKSVATGKHQLIYVVPVKAPGDDEPTSFTIAKEVDVSIEGEGAVLSALGIPVFLLLPGYVLVLVMALLWNRGVSRHPALRTQTPVDMKSFQFIGLAVGVSLVLVAVWTRLINDVLGEHSMWDLVLVGAAAGLLGAALYLIPMKIVGARLDRKTPTRDDSKTTILAKLGRQKLQLKRPTYQSDGNAVFALQKEDPTRPSTWFAPRIGMKWNGDAIGREALDRIVAKDDPGALATALAAELNASRVELSWDPPGLRPFSIPTDEVGEAGPENWIVYWEE